MCKVNKGATMLFCIGNDKFIPVEHILELEEDYFKEGKDYYDSQIESGYEYKTFPARVVKCDECGSIFLTNGYDFETVPCSICENKFIIGPNELEEMRPFAKRFDEYIGHKYVDSPPAVLYTTVVIGGDDKHMQELMNILFYSGYVPTDENDEQDIEFTEKAMKMIKEQHLLNPELQPQKAFTLKREVEEGEQVFDGTLPFVLASTELMQFVEPNIAVVTLVG